MRRKLVVVLVAVGLVVGLGIQPADADPHESRTTYAGWAGINGSYTQVQAKWTIPVQVATSYPSNQYMILAHVHLTSGPLKGGVEWSYNYGCLPVWQTNNSGGFQDNYPSGAAFPVCHEGDLIYVHISYNTSTGAVAWHMVDYTHAFDISWSYTNGVDTLADEFSLIFERASASVCIAQWSGTTTFPVDFLYGYSDAWHDVGNLYTLDSTINGTMIDGNGGVVMSVSSPPTVGTGAFNFGRWTSGC